MSQTMTPGLDVNTQPVANGSMNLPPALRDNVDTYIAAIRSQWGEEVWRDVLEVMVAAYWSAGAAAWGELDADINRAYSAVKSEAYAHAIAEGASTNIATVFADAAAVAYCSGAVQRLYDALNWRWFRATERWS
jgi:hypothetical protein